MLSSVLKSERATGERGSITMRRKRIDKNMPIGKLSIVEDFLPPPDKLITPEETVKVTLFLNKSSVDFFKHKARQCHTKYQKMVRELINRYAIQYAHAGS